MNHSFEVAEQLKELYPEGTRVECVLMPDDPRPIPPGTKGTVKGTNGFGQIHVKWDNGSGLSLIDGVDQFKVIREVDN